jgi:hypothetical protein
MKITLNRDWFQDGEFDYLLEELKIDKFSSEHQEIIEVTFEVDSQTIGFELEEELKND